MAEARVARGPDWGILYDASLIEDPTPAAFAGATYGGGAEMIRGRPAGPVLDLSRGGRAGIKFVQRPDGHRWVIRPYRRGGLFGRVIHDSYVWLGEERTRCFAEWRLMHHLHEAGLPVPRPVAAGYRRSGPVYRADLLTREIPNAWPLSSSVRGPGPVPWRAIGETIRRFHDAGAYHADLNAHNILFDEDGGVHLLDFDRGEIRGDGPWKRANLARLERSLRKIGAWPGGRPFNEYGWGVLVSGYEAGRRANSP